LTVCDKRRCQNSQFSKKYSDDLLLKCAYGGHLTIP